MDYSSILDQYSDYPTRSSGGNPIISLIIWAALVLAYWFIFMKANEPGWKSIVPFLNTWTMFELAYGGSGWKMILYLVPGLNIVVHVAFSIRFAQAFGMHWAFGLGLAFLPNIFYLILAFGPFTYRGPATNSFL